MEFKESWMSGIPFSLDPIHLCEPSDKKIYYHYTSMEKLWKILEGEQLRATQACFSNDSEEISMGIKVIKKVCKELFLGKDTEMMTFIENLSRDDLDSYIICFCDKDDKLSQWRAYCKKGGASIGFAFDDSLPSYYFSKMEGYRRVEKNCQLYPVFYYNYDSVCKKCSKCLTHRKLKKIIKNKMKIIGDNQAKKMAILEIIPYIKHCGFCEEEEHRLLIENPLDYSMRNTAFVSDEIVEYFENDGKKSPHINISFSNNINSSDRNICIFCEEVQFDDILDKISKEIEKYNITVPDDKKIVLDNIKHVTSKEKKILIGQCEESVQKQLFGIIDRINSPLDIDNSSEIIPIWCDGHLPIRTITVAPSLDQERQISMIKHFCTHNQFWMKYVKVVGSKIPYRYY